VADLVSEENLLDRFIRRFLSAKTWGRDTERSGQRYGKTPRESLRLGASDSVQLAVHPPGQQCEPAEQHAELAKPVRVFLTSLDDIRPGDRLIKTRVQLEQEFLARTYPEVEEWMRPGVPKFWCRVAVDLELQRLLRSQEEIWQRHEPAWAEFAASHPERGRAAQVLAERVLVSAWAIKLIEGKKHA
jgi:hypothetical protein